MKSLFTGLLFFSQVLFAAQSGTFMVVKGKVKIESAGTAVDARVGSKIQVGETVVTENDSRAKIVMSDRNIINVSPNTKIKIEKYTNSANDKNVNLNLIEGKIRNNVHEKYNGKNSKFQVKTATAVAGVRGTQFITSFDRQTRITEVVTLRGEVTLQALKPNTDVPSGDPVVVKKGEKSEAKEGVAPAEPTKVPDKEIKQIEQETTVKKDPPPPSPGSEAQNPPPPAVGSEPRGSDANNPQPPTDPLKDLTNNTSPVKSGTTERKFDKSKVKIITQPN